MTAGHPPTHASRVNDPLLAIPFETVLLVAGLLGSFFAMWSLVGMADSYDAIGHDWISLDVPYTDETPVDRGGSR